jgi:hypothetical protein
MLNLAGCRYNGTQARRRGWHPVVALVVIALVGCSDTSGPPTPGSIQVKTQTSGFLKASSYDLVVAGASEGTIGATDEVTVSGLDPGSYLVDLGNVPANCSAEGVTVTVTSQETTVVPLVVECTHDQPSSYTVQFVRQRPDLDTGEITVCPFGICSTNEAWDFHVFNNIQTQPRSVIRQNQTTGVEIAHISGVTLVGLREAHFNEATFTTQWVEEPFGSGKVILIRTDLGNVFALGNPVEDTVNGTLTFDAALIARP